MVREPENGSKGNRHSVLKAGAGNSCCQAIEDDASKAGPGEANLCTSSAPRQLYSFRVRRDECNTRDSRSKKGKSKWAFVLIFIVAIVFFGHSSFGKQPRWKKWMRFWLFILVQQAW